VLCNVSFGILAFHPLGWGLMLLVVCLEGFLLSRTLPASPGRSYFYTSLAANGVSGVFGFVASMILNGGWWLVVWVPWVTAYEASREQWKYLAIYMAAAYASSVLLESLVVRMLLRQVKFRRILAAQAFTNLVSSILLLAVFWWKGGVPGYGPR
jgi:hypothetical protein